MRNLGLLVRAGGPRRSQASSLRIRFCRRSSVTAACARAPPWPARTPHSRRRRRGRRRRRPPRSVVAHRVEEPAVVGDGDERRAGRVRRVARWSASQATPSTSRWLVGSSRTSRSGSATSSRASATAGARRRTSGRRPRRGRRDRAPMPPSSPSRTSRMRGSPAHSCSGRSPSTTSRTVARGVERVGLGRACRSVRPPVRVTRPASASWRPASTRSRVVLPSPLRPTTPIRSPAPTPRLDAVEDRVVPRARVHARGRRGWHDSCSRDGGCRCSGPSGGLCARPGGPRGRPTGRHRGTGRWARPARPGAGRRRQHVGAVTGPARAGRGTPRRQRHGQVERRLAVRDEERAGRTGAGHDAAEGADSIPVASTSLRPGLQGQRRLLQVVGQRPAERLGVAGAQRRHQSARTARARAPAPGPGAGRTRRRPRAWRARRR